MCTSGYLKTRISSTWRITPKTLASNGEPTWWPWQWSRSQGSLRRMGMTSRPWDCTRWLSARCLWLWAACWRGRTRLGHAQSCELSPWSSQGSRCWCPLMESGTVTYTLFYSAYFFLPSPAVMTTALIVVLKVSCSVDSKKRKQVKPDCCCFANLFALFAW